jgi:GntR family transcriptional regulator / MocR family aminotransferase
MDLHLDLDGDGPLRVRCEHALRAAVRRLAPGTRLPPTRALAGELGISRGVVVEAYAQLAAEGYLLTRRGGGTFVAGGASGGATAAGARGVATRGDAVAVAGGASAIGGGASAVGGRTSAVGGATRAVGAGTSVVGGGASAVGGRTSAVSGGTRAVGAGTSAIGGGASAGGDRASRVGEGASAVGARAGVDVRARAPRFDLRPALPALDGAFRPAWGRALNRALRATPDARLGYPDPQGEPELRQALAESLARRRGLQATADEVVVTGGLGPALPFVWRLLAARGVKRVAIEDPCWPRLTATLTGAGLEPVPIRVDEHGLDTDALRDAGAVFVTPAHQYPTGAVLSPARRARLIEWARRRAAFVFEDDYDAEFRYDRHPVGSLQGLAPDVVIYGGSTSKSLAPGLRLGWLVLPKDIRAETPAPPPVLDQLALADLITRGDFDRHLRHHRRLYQRRREALLNALGARLPEHAISGAAAGLHAVIHVTTDAHAIKTRAAARGVELDAIDGRLVVGYANLPESQAPAAVEALAAALVP